MRAWLAAIWLIAACAAEDVNTKPTSPCAACDFDRDICTSLVKSAARSTCMDRYMECLRNQEAAGHSCTSGK